METSLLHVNDGLIVSVARRLEEGSLVWCGANIAYDWGCVLAVRPDLLPLIWKAYEEERVFDVLIAGTLDAIYDGRLREGELFSKDGSKIQKGRYSLETIVKDYLGRTDAKRNDRWRKSYALLEHLPISEWPEDARQYPIDDAVNTLEAAEKQLKVCQNLHDLPRQAHAAFCTHLGAIWGLRTDAARVVTFKAEVDSHIKETQAYAVAQGLMKPKWKGRKPNKVIDGYSKDTKVIAERVFKAYEGLPPTTETGKISASRETLEDSGDPVLEKFAEGSKWDKLSVYAETLAQTTGIPYNVACNILVSTGRASYAGLIQLMPRRGGVRECFVPREDNCWSSVDYSFIELVGLAQVQLWSVGHSKLAEAINEGIDPHSLFAAKMTGVSYEEFLKNKKRPKEAGLRQAAKACLAADTQVLTPRGWVPIVQVTTQDRVWDGESWVTHEGLLDQGTRETEIFAAVEATQGHGVLTGRGWREWTEVHTSPSLFRSALDLATLPSSNGIDASLTGGRSASFRSSDATAGSSSGPLDTSSSTDTPRGAGAATKPRSDPSATSTTRAQCPTSEREQCSSTDSTPRSTGARTPRIVVTETTEAEGSESLPSGSQTSPSSFDTSARSTGTQTQSDRWTESTTTEGTSLGTSSSQHPPRTSETEPRSQNCESESSNSKRRSPVFDLLNAGPNHRFTILSAAGPLIVSNCNFGFPGMMGAPKFVIAKKKEKEDDGKGGERPMSVCRWIHHDERCGEEKLRAWKGKDLDAPLCKRCVEEAESLRNQYLDMWPEMKPYWKWVTAQMGHTERAEQFISKRVRGGLSGPAAANTYFQGLVADGAKKAVVVMTKEMYLDRLSPLFGSRLMIFSHDETIAEMNLRVAHEAATRQATIMREEMQKYMPDVKVSCEPALMTYWTKAAEPVLVDGRLVPWAEVKKAA